jgi:hypothetical protein
MLEDEAHVGRRLGFGGRDAGAHHVGGLGPDLVG